MPDASCAEAWDLLSLVLGLGAVIWQVPKTRFNRILSLGKPKENQFTFYNEVGGNKDLFW